MKSFVAKDIHVGKGPLPFRSMEEGWLRRAGIRKQALGRHCHMRGGPFAIYQATGYHVMHIKRKKITGQLSKMKFHINHRTTVSGHSCKSVDTLSVRGRCVEINMNFSTTKTGNCPFPFLFHPCAHQSLVLHQIFGARGLIICAVSSLFKQNT